MDPKIKQELWRRGELRWKLHEGQLSIYNKVRALDPKIREVVLLISRRWGKSYMGAVMALEDCLKNPGSQVFIIGPTLVQTTKIITPLITEIGLDAPAGLIKQTKSEKVWKVGDSVLHIGAFETASLESIRGLKAFSIYFEETRHADPNTYDYAMKSVFGPALIRRGGRGTKTHLTTPPNEMDHPFILETMVKAEADGALFVHTIEDNPLLTPEDIAFEIKEAGGRGSEHCERELFCKIVQDEKGIIVPEFDEELHVKPLNVPSRTNYLVAIDFGGVKDNHALLLCYFDFERNRACFLDEAFLDINTSTESVIEAGLELERYHKVVWLSGTPKRIIDAPGQTVVDIKRLGYKCTPPSKGKDSVEDGIQAIRVSLAKNQIEIDPKCKKLIQTLKYGTWDKSRKDFRRSPTLGHCDMLAAMSYAFRHMDRHNNPIPSWKNSMSHEDNWVTHEGPDDNESALLDAFYGLD